jgi:hypothetical protein
LYYPCTHFHDIGSLKYDQELAQTSSLSVDLRLFEFLGADFDTWAAFSNDLDGDLVDGSSPLVPC